MAAGWCLRLGVSFSTLLLFLNPPIFLNLPAHRSALPSSSVILFSWLASSPPVLVPLFSSSLPSSLASSSFYSSAPRFRLLAAFTSPCLCLFDLLRDGEGRGPQSTGPPPKLPRELRPQCLTGSDGEEQQREGTMRPREERTPARQGWASKSRGEVQGRSRRKPRRAQA